MYLDSPAGVGMSYSLNKSDYMTRDLKTAADAHKFLLKVHTLFQLSFGIFFLLQLWNLQANLMCCCSGLSCTPSFSRTPSAFQGSHMQGIISPHSQMKLLKVDTLTNNDVIRIPSIISTFNHNVCIPWQGSRKVWSQGSISRLFLQFHSFAIRCTTVHGKFLSMSAMFIQGYLIGNGATDVNYDYNAFVPFAHGMGLISTDMYEVCGSAHMLILTS